VRRSARHNAPLEQNLKGLSRGEARDTTRDSNGVLKRDDAHGNRAMQGPRRGPGLRAALRPGDRAGAPAGGWAGASRGGGQAGASGAGAAGARAGLGSGADSPLLDLACF
jgi:hypothetical protein